MCVLLRVNNRFQTPCKADSDVEMLSSCSACRSDYPVSQQIGKNQIPHDVTGGRIALWSPVPAHCTETETTRLLSELQ